MKCNNAETFSKKRTLKLLFHSSILLCINIFCINISLDKNNDLSLMGAHQMLHILLESTRVGFKYTFCYQMQLGQIKSTAFPDFNSNTTTNFQFKYKCTAIFYSNMILENTLPFFKFDSNTGPCFYYSSSVSVWVEFCLWLD